MNEQTARDIEEGFRQFWELHGISQVPNTTPVPTFYEKIIEDIVAEIKTSQESSTINLETLNDRYWAGYRHACDDILAYIKERFKSNESQSTTS